MHLRVGISNRSLSAGLPHVMLTSSSSLCASSSRRAASARPPGCPCPACQSWMRASMRVISGTDVTGLSQSFRLFWLVVVPIAGMRSLTYRKMWRHHFRARLLRAARSRCCGPRSSTFRSRPARWIVLIG